MTDRLAMPDDDAIMAYILGLLPATEATAVATRIATDSVLRERVASIQTSLWVMAESPPQLSPSANLRGRLLDAIEAEQRAAPVGVPPLAPPVPLPTAQSKPRVRPLAPPARPWLGWLAAAAMVLVVTLGSWDILLLQRLERQQATISRQEMALQTLIAADRFWTMRGVPERAPEALSTLALNLRHSQTVLAVTGFPVLPPDQSYQVWVIQNGQQVAVGTFSPPTTASEVTLVIPSNLAGVTHAMITVEPAGGSVQPTGVVVMDGDL